MNHSASANAYDSTQADDGWQACDGEIHDLAATKRMQARHQQLQQVTLVGGAMVIVLAFGLMLSQRLNHGAGLPLGGIACGNVMEHAPEYVAGTLNASLNEQISAHLQACPNCRDYVDGLREPGGASAESPKTPKVVGPVTSHRMLAAQ